VLVRGAKTESRKEGAGGAEDRCYGGLPSSGAMGEDREVLGGAEGTKKRALGGEKLEEVEKIYNVKTPILRKAGRHFPEGGNAKVSSWETG